MSGRCKYPGCQYKASKTFALVGLCENHFDTIKFETERYYLGAVTKSNKSYGEVRQHYMKIAHLIPWSRLNRGEVLPDGSLRGH